MKNWIATLNANRDKLAIINHYPSIDQLLLILKSLNTFSKMISLNYINSIDINTIIRNFDKYSQGERLQATLYIKSIINPSVSELTIEFDKFFSVASKSVIERKNIITK